MSAPTRDTWRALLRPALRVIDSLEHNGYGKLDFRLGGGTVLMLRFDHRISKDIDIFTYDAQALGFLSPRLNDVAEREATTYEEHSNTIKLVLPEGDIDFIVAGTILPEVRPEHRVVDGRTLILDSTAEILAKKLLYRADSFKPRDVFDMSAAISLEPDAAVCALRATVNTRAALVRRLSDMASVPPTELLAQIEVTQTGRAYEDDMVGRLQRAMVQVDSGGSDSGQPA